MTAEDWSREIAAVTPHIQGASIELRGTCAQPIPGVDQMVESSPTGLAKLADQSADSIVSIGGLDQQSDPVSTLRS